MDQPTLTIDQAIANLQGADLGLRIYAAWWLGRFRVATPEAIAQLVVALGDEDDRTAAGGYPLRRNAARALGKLGQAQVVPALVKALTCSDFYVREAAAQALEGLGDRSCIPDLIALLQNQVEGTQPAGEPPQLVQPFEAILEALGALGATEAIALIYPFLNHEVPLVRLAAARALYQLTPDSEQAGQYGDRLIQGLYHEDSKLRRAALSDLGAIGYLPAAEAISETLAENSLKLISLKGILEKELEGTTHTPDLSPEAIQVMTLMDGLL